MCGRRPGRSYLAGEDLTMSEQLINNLAEPGAPELQPKTESGKIRREIGEDGICVLTFDRPGSAANIFDRATLEELNDHLNFLDRSSGIKGVVVASAKPNIFIAGADLNALGSIRGNDELLDYIKLGQDVFSRLEALGVPTVAAIHGACVGGGFEICLACNYRIASAEKTTKIGLPETQLGILPAWGGSTRLPRLIGLPKALDVIVAGKTVAARQALKYGMVDELAPREYLLDVATKRILSGAAAHPKRKGGFLLKVMNSGIASSMIEKKARQNVM